MKSTMLVFTTAMTLGCGAPRPAPMTPLRAHDTGCESLGYSKSRLRFRCDAVVYDLMETPVRSRRIFDIVQRETFTRRHYVVRAGARRFAYKAEQMEGEPYPRRVVLQTRRGFARLLLDPQGQVVWSGQAVDLDL